MSDMTSKEVQSSMLSSMKKLSDKAAEKSSEGKSASAQELCSGVLNLSEAYKILKQMEA